MKNIFLSLKFVYLKWKIITKPYFHHIASMNNKKKEKKIRALITTQKKRIEKGMRSRKRQFFIWKGKIFVKIVFITLFQNIFFAFCFCFPYFHNKEKKKPKPKIYLKRKKLTIVLFLKREVAQNKNKNIHTINPQKSHLIFFSFLTHIIFFKLLLK